MLFNIMKPEETHPPDFYLNRIEKKITKLTSRIFRVSAEERIGVLERISKLKQRRIDYQLTRASLRVPDGLARESRRLVKSCQK